MLRLWGRTSSINVRKVLWTLQELGVPFIFASGYGEQASLPMEHRARQVLQKPYTIENIARALVELLESSD